MALTETELITAANIVRKQHGFRAPSWICGRIAELEKAGDTEGAEHWGLILERVSEITSNEVPTMFL